MELYAKFLKHAYLLSFFPFLVGLRNSKCEGSELMKPTSQH